MVVIQHNTEIKSELHAPALKDITKIIQLSALPVILNANHAAFRLIYVIHVHPLTSEYRAETLVFVLWGTSRIH